MKQLLKTIIYCILFLCTLEGLAYLSTLKPKRQVSGNKSFSSIVIQDELGRKGVPYGQWKEIKLNRFGLHDSDDYVLNNKGQAIRILCLGDSITFGTFTPPHNWPRFLEEQLTQAGLNVQVINAAFPGNSYPELYARFYTDYINFNPDFVLVYKDFRYYMALSEKSHQPERTWINALGKSYFLSRIIRRVPRDPLKRLKKERFLKGISEPIEDVKLIGYEAFRKDLEYFIRNCIDAGVTPVLANFPSLVDETNFELYKDIVYGTLYFYPVIGDRAYLRAKPRFNAIIIDAAREFDCPYVNLSEKMQQNLTIFTDDYHLTVQGARLVAESYAKTLIQLIEAEHSNSPPNNF
jgi:lysophospholipase L1-like esterase